MKMKFRFSAGVGTAFFLVAVIGVMCAYMQLLCADSYIEKAEIQSLEMVSLDALRGEITDRNGEPLVSNRLCLSVETDSEGFFKLCEFMNVSADKIDKELIESGERFIAARDVGSKIASEISEKDIDGVRIVKDYVRDYLEFPKLSHTLGYVGLISAEEYDNLSGDGYRLNSFVGKSGIEQVCENELRGNDGERRTREGNIVFEKKAQNGKIIELTIDKRLQEAVEAELTSCVKKTEEQTGLSSGGAVVVLNVKNGEVLAMASFPDYNLENISKDYESLLNTDSNPLLNRCISGAYEPGSTFKPLVALAALNEGVVTAEQKISDKGIYTFYSPTYTPTCHIWNEKRKTHGDVDVKEALSVSCNYYFYEAGRRLTINKIADYAKRFRLGEKCGIELEGEVTGTLASPETKKEWYPGDTLQAAIGQSVNMFTPIQLASYIGAVANNGTLYRPYIVKSIKSTEGDIERETKAVIEKVIDISEKNFQTVKNGMRECVLSGTAESAFEGADFTAAGKTGSAQVPGGPENGLFVGFAPFETPEIAISVVIEHGAGGYASQLSAKIFDKYLDLY